MRSNKSRRVSTPPMSRSQKAFPLMRIKRPFFSKKEIEDLKKEAKEIRKREKDKKNFPLNGIIDPFSQKELEDIKNCEHRFCRKYYVPKIKKRTGAYNPANLTQKRRNDLWTEVCARHFCLPKDPLNLNMKNPRNKYHNIKYTRNRFHKSIPTKRVEHLKKLGALSGYFQNRSILR